MRLTDDQKLEKLHDQIEKLTERNTKLKISINTNNEKIRDCKKRIRSLEAVKKVTPAKVVSIKKGRPVKLKRVAQLTEVLPH